MHRKQRCILIPALKKSASIPDQLVKKLAGTSLIQRAIDTAKGVVAPEDIWVLTDSQEICLICERNGVHCAFNRTISLNSRDRMADVKAAATTAGMAYQHLIFYEPACPLITSGDIMDAYNLFTHKNAEGLVSLQSKRYRLWEQHSDNPDNLEALVFNDEQESVFVETKALTILNATALGNGQASTVTPYFLNDRALEINSYQDWWICEKLLQRKHIVFVVAGFPAIGMGHIYRAMMLAHEISDHKITFLCTKDSELAVQNITERDYKTRIQTSENLADDVLALRPDMVINDILETTGDYIAQLKSAGIRVVNFEDNGPGAPMADIVINALYEHKSESSNILHGYRYFCLRDEFLQSQQRSFPPQVRSLLITFGGTDDSDFTRQTLLAVGDLCRQHDIAINVVAGPGYVHREGLQELLTNDAFRHVEFTFATNVMSRVMEQADLAICSAGRTVYELAHMRIPSLVFSHHIREDMHTFARPRNGFKYLGVMHPFDTEKVRKGFVTMLDPAYRRTMYNRMSRFDFTANKHNVIQTLQHLLKEA